MATELTNTSAVRTLIRVSVVASVLVTPRFAGAFNYAA